MRKLLLAFVLVFGWCVSAQGNTGVFFGAGHTLRLVKSADVRMVSEEVVITPQCGASYSEHTVDFRCKFVLKNLAAKSVVIQAGFPLDRRASGPPKTPVDDTDEVLTYHFIARDAKNTYHVTGLLQTCGRVRKMRPRSRKSQSKCPAQTLGASRAFGPRNARRSVVPRANITSNAANRAILPTRDTAGWSSQRHASSRHTFTRQREKPL